MRTSQKGLVFLLALMRGFGVTGLVASSTKEQFSLVCGRVPNNLSYNVALGRIVAAVILEKSVRELNRNAV
jgi:hypothetical protein